MATIASVLNSRILAKNPSEISRFIAYDQQIYESLWTNSYTVSTFCFIFFLPLVLVRWDMQFYRLEQFDFLVRKGLSHGQKGGFRP
jgi:hypothetical protein